MVLRKIIELTDNKQRMEMLTKRTDEMQKRKNLDP